VYHHYDVFRKNLPILLLDEATDALDNESRNLIEKSLTDLFIVKATLIIANRRKKTIRAADRIIVSAKKDTHWRLRNGIIREERDTEL